MAKLVTVKFIKAAAPYNVGDVAGFEASAAKAMIADGIAEAFKASKTKAVVESEEKRVSVTFLRGAPPYNAGDVAGFAPLIAARLVAEGKAILNANKSAEAASEVEPEIEAEQDVAEDDAAEEAAEAEAAANDEPLAIEPDDDAEDGAPPVQGVTV
ncbi:hypothetical protein SAMN05877809_105284 [Rhodobacter sp. JA431]|uniref:hypothetical protein n=1 Tax=Rhodobacter sp. JA431 TaxID=570013 RepID=UPI000BD05914|nr:hypothetical protein [Rhodobacter sp. JA431]SOC11430.1 hypothetical protein SAMN05877809_105284 [Rhodobacter sp. JA431]